MKPYNCVQINDCYLIKLSMIGWLHITVCKSFVLDMYTWYCITVCKKTYEITAKNINVYDSLTSKHKTNSGKVDMPLKSINESF